LLFSFVGNFIYDEDAPAAERRAQALTIDHAQLRELLGETELRKLLDPEVVAEHEAQLLRRERPLRHADALHDLLLWLGDLDEREILARAETPAAGKAMLDALVREKRVLRVKIAGELRAIAVEDAARYRDALGVVLERGLPQAFLGKTDDALVTLVARHARTHGPFTAEEVAARYGVGVASAESALAALVARGKVQSGAFRPLPPGLAMRGRASAQPEYCDTEVLRVLRRKTLARLRKAIEPVTAAAFTRFLLGWQGVASLAAPRPARDDDDEAPRSRGAPMHPEDALLRAIQLLEACPVPASVLEKHVLPARVPGYQPYMLDQLLATGEVVWAGIEPIGASDGRVALYLADREPLLARAGPPGGEGDGAAAGAALHARIRELLERRGAVFFPEITRTLGVFPSDVLEALWDLVWRGEVTNDTFEAVRSFVRGAKERDRDEGGRRARRARPTRMGPTGSEGRWSLRRARWATTPTATERATATARALLERYGVVLREAAGAEGIPNGFGAVYDVLRAMEDQGRVRRGYFVAGRGATQFALPGAEERLRARPLGQPAPGEHDELDARGDTRAHAPASDDDDTEPVVIAATDPANPWGALLPWPEVQGRAAQRTPGARVILWDGALVGWLARGGQHLVTFLPREEPEATRTATALGRALVALAARGKRAWLLATIDGVAAPESPLAKHLAGHGFVARQGALSLLPSRERDDGGTLEGSLASRRDGARTERFRA
jgi:ATP-dependent Lhr-like helicase